MTDTLTDSVTGTLADSADNVDAPALATITISLSDPIGMAYRTGDDGEVEQQPITLACALLDRLEARYAQTFAPLVNRMLQDRLAVHIDSVAADLVANAVNTPIRRTNEWGEPTGKETTVRDAIQQQVTTWLTTRAKDYGRGSDDNLGILIKREVEQALAKDMRAAVDAGKAEVAEALKVRAAELFADTLRRVVQ
jgi:hypothetical protein